MEKIVTPSAHAMLFVLAFALAMDRKIPKIVYLMYFLSLFPLLFDIACWILSKFHIKKVISCGHKPIVRNLTVTLIHKGKKVVSVSIQECKNCITVW